MNQTFYSIQFLRGAAAISVVLHHFMQVFYDFERTNFMGDFLSDFGGKGVDVFFVLSGFIMAYIATIKEKSPKTFIVNRIIRIVPIYWFYTFIVLILGVFIQISSSEATIQSILQSLFFIPHENPSDQLGVFPTLSVGWTLNYEMFFYTLVALVLLCCSKIKSGLLWLAFILCVLVVLNRYTPELDLYFKFYLIEFSLGIILYFFHQSRMAVYSFFILMIALLVLILSIHPVINRLIASFAIVLLALSLEKYINKEHVLSRIGLFLGDKSFSIYLSHSIVLFLMASVFGDFHSQSPPNLTVISVLFLSLFVTLLVSYLSYQFIEIHLSNGLKAKFIRPNEN